MAFCIDLGIAFDFARRVCRESRMSFFRGGDRDRTDLDQLMERKAAQEFEVGNLYSNEEIFRGLEVGNAGGVRVNLSPQSKVRRLVVMTSVPSARSRSENPYHDRIEGDVLVYTGAGREGDQVISGPNARLAQQIEERFPIYGFMLMESRRKSNHKRWAFLGLLELQRYFREDQVDSNKQLRSAWVFELRVLKEPMVAGKGSEAELLAQSRRRARNSGGVTKEDRQVVNLQERERRTSELLAIEATRAKLLAYDARAFELLLESLLIRSGFEQVQVTPYTQDGGIDVNAYPSRTAWPIRRLLVQLQAKRWLHTVGRKDVAELRGSLQPHARGCIVTTSHFSRAAIAEASELGKAPIELIDGHELAKIVLELKMDVAEFAA